MGDLTLAMTSTGAIPPGTRLGKYEIVRRLRSGGMAEIYLARRMGAAGIEQAAVIKRILPHLAQDPEFITMFVNEAKITSSLDHPCITHVKEVGEVDGELFLALEYVSGVDLHRVLKATKAAGGVALAPALAIVTAVAEALHYAHERKIIHRDLSPSNVMVTHQGHTKVLDFGIAKAALTRVTRSAMMKGKIGYMSPEQCTGDPIDRRSDVFALGILLYEMTVGHRTFSSESDFAVMNMVTQGRFTLPRQRRPDFPAGLEAIILKALAVKPDDRFATAEAFRAAVDEFAHREGLRITAAAVAAWMESLFGEPPSNPLAEAPRTSTVAKQARQVSMLWTDPKRRRTALPVLIGVAATALVVGIVIGVSGTFSPAPADAAAATPVAPALPPASPAPVLPKPDPPPVPADDVVAAGTPASADPVPAPAEQPKRATKKRRGKRRGKHKGKAKKNRDRKSPGFMPPSRSEG